MQILNNLKTLAESFDFNPTINQVGTTTPDLNTSIVTILNGVIGLVAIVAVIMIVIAGVTYITSGGDKTKAQKATSTILYGVIGLVICALSAAIVNFVIATLITGDAS